MSAGAPHDPFTVLVDDPITNEVHHPYSAYNQGHDAGQLGDWTREKNPYPPESREHRWWLYGWTDAQDDEPF